MTGGPCWKTCRVWIHVTFIVADGKTRIKQYWPIRRASSKHTNAIQVGSEYRKSVCTVVTFLASLLARQLCAYKTTAKYENVKINQFKRLTYLTAFIMFTSQTRLKNCVKSHLHFDFYSSYARPINQSC